MDICTFKCLEYSYNIVIIYLFVIFFKENSFKHVHKRGIHLHALNTIYLLFFVGNMDLYGDNNIVPLPGFPCKFIQKLRTIRQHKLSEKNILKIAFLNFITCFSCCSCV